MLNDRIQQLIHSGTKVTRASLTQAMEDAAVTDLRGEDILPELLKVIDSAAVTDPQLKQTVDGLKNWLADGAKRHETSPGSHTYAHADTVRTVDAWWPLLVKAEFEPTMGGDLYTAMTRALQIDEPPSAGEAGVAHKGSAFQHGWWSYVDKDLRSVLGRTVPGAAPVTFCGAGDLAQCRHMLLTTLQQAAATPASTVYPGDDVCQAGDQWCADAIEQHPLGGITDDLISWQNRPTYQQVVQFPAHRPGTRDREPAGRRRSRGRRRAGGVPGVRSARRDAEPVERVPAAWTARFGLLWLGVWAAWLVPVQLLLPEQLADLDTAHKVRDFAVVNGLAGVAALVALPVCGALCDGTRSRFGRRRVWMAAGVAAFALCLAATGTADSWAAVAGCWTGASIGLSAASAGLFAAVADRVPDRQRGVVSGAVFGPQALGILLGLVVCTQLISSTLGGYLAMTVLLCVLSRAVRAAVRGDGAGGRRAVAVPACAR